MWTWTLLWGAGAGAEAVRDVAGGCTLPTLGFHPVHSNSMIDDADVKLHSVSGAGQCGVPITFSDATDIINNQGREVCTIIPYVPCMYLTGIFYIQHHFLKYLWV